MPPQVDAPDPIGVALGGIGAGATAGASVVTTSLIVLRYLAGGAQGLSQDAHFTIVTVGVAAGLATAFIVAYTLARAIAEPWRRAAIAGTTVFATALLGVVAVPMDMVAGAAGLTGYLAVLLAIAWYAVGQAKTAARK